MSEPGAGPKVAVIIEDDDDIRHLLEAILTQAGFQTVAKTNGIDGIEAVRTFHPVVTTLDVNMPGIDGFETAKRIRAFSSSYIVMLTALEEEIDALRGLESGADDYITKPFRPREFRARIEAMLRRPRHIAQSPQPTAATPSVDQPTVAPPALAPAVDAVSAGTQPELQLSPRAEADGLDDGYGVRESGIDGWQEHNGLWISLPMRLTEIDGREVALTRSEFELLVGLLASKRRVRTKADLALLLRGESYVTSHFVSEADKRGIEVHMGNLRKKLGESATSPRWIETVRGVGYRLTARDGD